MFSGIRFHVCGPMPVIRSIQNLSFSCYRNTETENLCGCKESL